MTKFALVEPNGRVAQVEDEANIFPIADPYVWIECPDEAEAGWTYIEGVFAPYTPPPPTEAQILAAQSLKLQIANQLAAAQKTALTNRIGVINDAIDFEESTQAELDELPVRQAQLTAWKRYAVLLGRVTTQPGWYQTVDWPAEPAEGMDLSVSAVARPVSAS